MKREANCPVCNEGIEKAVLGYSHMDQSVTKLSDASGVSRSSVHRILQTRKYDTISRVKRR